MELSLCSSSGDTKSSWCRFIPPGQRFPSAEGSKLLCAEQMKGSQSFPDLLHTHIPFLSQTNHLSFLFKGPVSPLCLFRGRADPGCGSLVTQVLGGLLDAVYLKESQGILAHKEVRGGLLIHGMQRTQRTLLVKAFPPPWFPLQPEPSWELSLTGTPLQPLGAPQPPPASPPYPWDVPAAPKRCFVSPAPAPCRLWWSGNVSALGTWLLSTAHPSETEGWHRGKSALLGSFWCFLFHVL